jgi:hypothetical protein
MVGRDTAVEMYTGSFHVSNLGYYHAVLKQRALLRSDPALVRDAAAQDDIVGVVVSHLFFEMGQASLYIN